MILYKIKNLKNLTTKELKILAKVRKVGGYENVSRHLNFLIYIPCF